MKWTHYRMLGPVLVALCCSMSLTGCGMIESAAERGVNLGFERLKKEIPNLLTENPTQFIPTSTVRDAFNRSPSAWQPLQTSMHKTTHAFIVRSFRD